MTNTRPTYYPIISAIAFVGVGGMTYHLLTTMCNVDTFSGLCGFVAMGLTAVLLLSLVLGPKAKAEQKECKPDNLDVELQKLPKKETMVEAHKATFNSCDKLEAIETCRKYVSFIAEKYFPVQQHVKLMEIFDSYCERRISTVKITGDKDALGLTPIDLMHFMVNIWRKMKWIDRRFTARFLKDAFPGVFKNTSEQTIYSKMTNDDLVSVIPLIDTDKPLIAA